LANSAVDEVCNVPGPGEGWLYALSVASTVIDPTPPASNWTTPFCVSNPLPGGMFEIEFEFAESELNW
jgi:hypothetical protein